VRMIKNLNIWGIIEKTACGDDRLAIGQIRQNALVPSAEKLGF
jgi:hypothetical protein